MTTIEIVIAVFLSLNSAGAFVRTAKVLLRLRSSSDQDLVNVRRSLHLFCGAALLCAGIALVFSLIVVCLALSSVRLPQWLWVVVAVLVASSYAAHKYIVRDREVRKRLKDN